MLISRTPFRVSFFGGGTDYPAWFKDHGGAVLSCALHHYCYVSARFLPPFFNHRSRIVWSKIELVREASEIEHLAIRGALEHLSISKGVEIHHQGDLPAWSGIGSSSSFSVGLFAALYHLLGREPCKRELAEAAINLEQVILKENVGIQDQIAAAYGGFNHIVIGGDGRFDVRPVDLPCDRQTHFFANFMLFYTGNARYSSEIAGETIQTLEKRAPDLHRIAEMVDSALDIVKSGADLTDFGRMLHDSWLIKRSLTPKISTTETDDIYARARAAGAIGGKILGAGGGGFMLLFVPPERQTAVANTLRSLTRVPIGLDTDGVTIIYKQDDPSEGYR